MSQPSPLLLLLAQAAGLGLAVAVLRHRAARSRHGLVALVAVGLLVVVAVPQLVQSAHGLRETRRQTADVTASDGRLRCFADLNAPSWARHVARLRTALPAGTRFAVRAPGVRPLSCVAFTALPRVLVRDVSDADVVVYAERVPADVRRRAAAGDPAVRLLARDLAVVEVVR